MRHRVQRRKLSRTTDERKRLFAGLITDLLIRDSLVTSIAKAKAVQPMVEKLITKAKTGGEVNRRIIISALGNRTLADQLLEDAKTRFSGRSSGFTRVIKVGKRRGDATDTAQLSFVDVRVITEVVTPKGKTVIVAEKKGAKTTDVKKVKPVAKKQTRVRKTSK